MAEGIQLGAGEQPAPSSQTEDNNAGSPNQDGAGERSAPLMARPDWVPEQFFKDGVIDYKGMAKGYSEIRTKMDSKAPAAEGEQQPAGEQKTEQKPAEQTPAATIPGVPAERVTHFTGEMQKDGKLSDASYDELAKLGYPKPVVDAYVRGLNVDQEVSAARIADTHINEIMTSVGGEKAFKEMVGWAKANWSAADHKVYNDAVGSKDPAKVKMAVQGLKAAYTEANGEQPNYLNLGGHRKPAVGGDGVQPYATGDEVAADMAKPEYKTSESFRQKVAAKLRVSDNVFTNSRDVSKVQR